tara:strand:- start:7318 stop:7455 length:138 start_codon:yes stop_codon:yes gene_type:complete
MVAKVFQLTDQGHAKDAVKHAVMIGRTLAITIVWVLENIIAEIAV